MPGTHERNTDGLINHAHHKSQKTAEKVDEVIQRLVKNKEKINFNSVSIESRVSKAYLYTHPEIRERIETLRKQQEGLPSPKQVKREMTDASKDIVIAAKNKRIKELEEDVNRIKTELMHLRGKIYGQ
jgi:predicted Zn-dependent protease